MYLSATGADPQVCAFPRVVGDIGGTNARFALQAVQGGPLEQVQKFACKDFPSFSAALTRYRTDLGHAVRAGAFGIANPVTGPDLRMTNHPWAFSIESVRAEQGLEALLFLNDFTALSLGLGRIRREGLTQIGGGMGDPHAPLAILGPGTGLGVSGLVPSADHGPHIPISGEGGHVSLAAGSDEEAALLALMRATFGHVSAERVLSGAGLVLLHNTIQKRTVGAQGLPVLPVLTDPSSVLEAAAQHDRLALATVRQFCQFLASVAGDLALTLGARGGVYLAGGISPRIQSYLLEPAFRARFEAKGRFQSYLSHIPIWLINDSLEPALMGASEALSRQWLRS
ncbi:MAG: hypothetical protein RJA77_1173 [Pseudomonadota bacterium]